MVRDLAEFVAVLRREGEIVDVDVPVDPCLEIPEVQRRVAAVDGPALLFQRPGASPFPLACNLLGSARRIDLAFGSRPERFVEEAVLAVDRLVPPTPRALWRHRGFLLQALRIGIREQHRAPVLEEALDPPDVRRLPVTTSWPADGGPFLTLPLVYTEHPATHRHNLGIYRMQCHGPAALGLHWQIGKGGGFHYHVAEERGEALPVTVHLGGPPALMVAALAPLPEDVPELILASLLLGGRLSVVRVPGHPLPIVADAEFALLGEAPAGVRRPEGPFGDHYGYSSGVHDYPVCEVRRLLHRRGAIYPSTVVGKPRQEDYYLGEYVQRLLSPIFPVVMPTVRRVWAYGETGFHPLAAAVVKERYAREAMASAFRILGEGQLSLTKFLLVVGEPLELTDIRSVLTHVLARARFEHDLYVFNHLSQDTLDYTGPEVNRGSKGVLLGLGPPVRELPRGFEAGLDDGFGRPTPFCPGCLVVEGPTYDTEPLAASRLVRCASLASWPLVVLVDDAREATRSAARFLWTTFTRFEPAGDIHASAARLERHHIAYAPPIVIDARLKPWYPPELFCDPQTAERVTRRWREYFPGGRVAMGESGPGHLDRGP